jgi:hypothetical protein
MAAAMELILVAIRLTRLKIILQNIGELHCRNISSQPLKDFLFWQKGFVAIFEFWHTTPKTMAEGEDTQALLQLLNECPRERFIIELEFVELLSNVRYLQRNLLTTFHFWC